MEKKMTTKIETITPKIAQELLMSCTHNRKPVQERVNVYAKDMLEGRWKTTSQGIAIDWNKCMHNGQHRLLAVVKSGVTLAFNVSREEDPENFKYLDTHGMRTSGVVFALAGVKNASRIAAIVKGDIIFRNIGWNSHQSDLTAGVTPSLLLERYNNNAEFYQNIHNKCSDWYTKGGKLLPVTTIAAFYMRICEFNEDKGNEFFDKLSTGLDLSGTQDPIYILRQKLINNVTSTKKYSSKFINAFVIKAWNLFISGKFCKAITFSDAEKFPDMYLGNKKEDLNIHPAIK